MRKIVLLIFMTVCLSMCVTVKAQKVWVPLVCHIHDITPINEKPARGPIDPPLVYLEDYTLTFEVDHPEYVLYIKDEDEVVVYSTVVTSAETEVMLPSTLSGDYEIELIMGDWLFSGWIEL